MSEGTKAWYVAKNADGSWDFTWSTKLLVLTWDHDEHGLTGFVQAPVGDGAAAAYLVPANDLEITGSSPTQYFLRYIPAT